MESEAQHTILVVDDTPQVLEVTSVLLEQAGFRVLAATDGGEAFARLFGERAAAFYLTNDFTTPTTFELRAEDERRYLVSVPRAQR